MRMEVIHGSRAIPKEEQRAFLASVSARMNARSLERRKERAIKRNSASPERQSVAIAMLAVEEQIVKALWTIARQPLGRIAPIMSARCGIDYVHERSDIHSIYADAAGGKWDSIAPKPAIPSAKEITAANIVQDWLLLIGDERLRKILVYGATSKRGDAGRQVNWMRVRAAMFEIKDDPVRTLNGKYHEALRLIASELTTSRMG